MQHQQCSEESQMRYVNKTIQKKEYKTKREGYKTIEKEIKDFNVNGADPGVGHLMDNGMQRTQHPAARALRGLCER